ncbi:unnamed protein product [Protopolystoma xenopodis]|uniref:Uncharacterized protein n=1 Tax=Protopolystoma xenopodis TaxID=117903 RepID=A0A3S5FCI4_9PLAT|nr:unnamed protein product [Protopolystoma xenopodis]
MGCCLPTNCASSSLNRSAQKFDTFFQYPVVYVDLEELDEDG